MTVLKVSRAINPRPSPSFYQEIHFHCKFSNACTIKYRRTLYVKEILPFTFFMIYPVLTILQIFPNCSLFETPIPFPALRN